MNTSFDESKHEYRIESARVPSVTQIIGDILPGWMASDWYLQRGSTVHACAALIAQGKPFELNLDNQSPEDQAEILGKLDAVRLFLKDVVTEVISVETQMFSASYRFAGTCDLICRTKYTNDKGVLVDWKGSLQKQCEYQLGFYSLLASEYGTKIDIGFGVELRGDGKYKMSQPYKLARTRQEALALLSVYNMRRACGIEVK